MAIVQYEGQEFHIEDEIAAKEDSEIQEKHAGLSPAWYPLQFRAIGIIKGQYFPSAEDMIRGIILTDDGAIAPAHFLASSIRFLKRRLELLDSPQYWIVFPATKQEPPYLRYAIKGMKTPEEVEAEGEELNAQKDRFSIRGVITFSDRQAERFVVRIYRNYSIEKHISTNPSLAISAKEEASFFLLTLQGKLPDDAFGQFADLDVVREGDQLILKDYRFVQQLLQPKKEKTKKPRSRRKHKSKTTRAGAQEPPQN